MDTAEYRVELRLDGRFIGDVRDLAQSLKWTKRRTEVGVDEIDFTINDVLFARWCEEQNTTIQEMLRPIALDCRLVRNGEPVIGGFLATMPGYSPNGTSANLAMKFDGYLNLLGGVYIHPEPTVTMRMAQMVDKYIKMADARAAAAGKGFGFTEGLLDTMDVVTQTFDGYKTVKEFIEDRCDNVTGAGKFDVYFHPDRTYDIIKDRNFGRMLTYAIQYPAQLNGISATSISANEVDGFASHVIGLGSGETSGDEESSTAITSEITNPKAVRTYGYAETLLQDSSVTRQETLDTNAATQLALSSNILWEPQLNLTGRQVAPAPTGDSSIWIGDTVAINNQEDLTGQTSGLFRVQEVAVDVSATGAETVTPALERVSE